MWNRLMSRPMGQFAHKPFKTFQYQSSHYTRRAFQHKPYATPVTFGFLGWLFGSVDYSAVKKDIANILDDDEWDDGSWGPILIRLAWHSSGTFSAKDGTGGPNAASMRFAPECDDGANAGLAHARNKLEKIKEKYPQISYADLWVLAAYVAIEEMGGPSIEFKSGRSDAKDSTACVCDRLPDAAQGASHVRDVFNRMGFGDEEIVALVGGGHAIGRCHTDRSGFDGPWTRAPTTISNEFFKRLFDEDWVEKKWKGPKQFVDKASGKIMMLPTDIAVKSDPEFRKIAKGYYDNEEKFIADFAAAFKKLTELGV